MAKSLLRDLTECSICMDTLKKPKALPCLHTFCLECLIKYSDDEDPGKSLLCPICRESFAIPEGGLGNLKGNFYIEKLVQVKQESKSLSSASSCVALCGICQKRSIARYCCECSDDMCDECATRHLRANVSKDHRVVNQEEKQAA